MTKEEKEKFQKLDIANYIELALLIPHSYEDLRLYDNLQSQKYQLIDVTIESVVRAPNSIQLKLFAHNFGHTVHAVLFRPKPYMMHQFQVGSREYLYGLIECKQGQCSMSMPRKITNMGTVAPKYKCNLRSDVMSRFVQKYLTKENLLEEGLPQSIAEEILALHFPTTLIDTKELTPQSLDALKYAEIYNYMKSLATKRRYFPSTATVTRSYEAWSKRLPFSLTDEQREAIKDIQSDFSKESAAKRMIVGDVGSGKTMVILAAAYMMQEKKSILMAPTTILANQLYEEAVKYLGSLKVVLVTNNSKTEHIEEYDFIIGTHALLYRELPDVGVVMVDEQHRFGTQQRNLLEKLTSSGRTKPHYLQFSATPIPRTQAMIESAHIDVSLITTTPFTKDIKSRVIRKGDFQDLLQHIEHEISNDKQVLLVYPLVQQSDALEYQSIQEARGFWEKRFENVYVTHGKDKEKEQVLVEFRERGSLLISTTVVEVGISLPRLTTVVIVGAERLGLSTLHQLRGRVSRTGLKGYCYLYTNSDASKRLESFVETTSGFDIAHLDLKFRKSGDLLKGLHQSGKEFRWFDFAEDGDVARRVKEGLNHLLPSRS